MLAIAGKPDAPTEEASEEHEQPKPVKRVPKKMVAEPTKLQVEILGDDELLKEWKPRKLGKWEQDAKTKWESDPRNVDRPWKSRA